MVFHPIAISQQPSLPRGLLANLQLTKVQYNIINPKGV